MNRKGASCVQCMVVVCASTIMKQGPQKQTVHRSAPVRAWAHARLYMRVSVHVCVYTVLHQWVPPSFFLPSAIHEFLSSCPNIYACMCVYAQLHTAMYQAVSEIHRVGWCIGWCVSRSRSLC